MAATTWGDMVEKFEIPEKNVSIEANRIQIGDDVTFGDNIDIKVRETFRIGDRSRLGDNAHIRGRSVCIGEDFFNSSGLRVGGGGRMHPNANLYVGDRCVFHNNFINIAEQVEIGNDVGLSPEVSILTHGFWQSVLDGYPAKFAPVKIYDGAIIGYRSLILPGAKIGVNAVVGAQSVVTGLLASYSVYAGSPAKLIRIITPPSRDEKKKMLGNIVINYINVAAYHDVELDISTNYPFITMNGCVFNAETFEVTGEEDETTDDFRDYMRKWGLRFYTKRPFRSKWDV